MNGSGACHAVHVPMAVRALLRKLYGRKNARVRGRGARGMVTSRNVRSKNTTTSATRQAGYRTQKRHTGTDMNRFLFVNRPLLARVILSDTPSTKPAFLCTQWIARAVLCIRHAPPCRCGVPVLAATRTNYMQGAAVAWRVRVCAVRAVLRRRHRARKSGKNTTRQWHGGRRLHCGLCKMLHAGKHRLNFEFHPQPHRTTRRARNLSQRAANAACLRSQPPPASSCARSRQKEPAPTGLSIYLNL